MQLGREGVACEKVMLSEEVYECCQEGSSSWLVLIVLQGFLAVRPLESLVILTVHLILFEALDSEGF